MNMTPQERKELFFSFFDQLKPEHAEKAKANYDGIAFEDEDIDTHSSALFYGSPKFSGLLDVHRQLLAKTYPLQLTPQVCKDKAKTIYVAPPTEPNLGTERMATQEDFDKLDKLTAKLPTDAAERKAIPIYSGFIKYFPLAIAEVAKLSRKGNDQHNPGQPLHWDRSKSGDEKDAMLRHIIDEDWTHVAWRALANLQKELENK
jgi:hypothetical protein